MIPKSVESQWQKLETQLSWYHFRLYEYHIVQFGEASTETTASIF